MEVLGPVPVRVLAERLGREPEALYYHVRKLVAAGLVYEVGQRLVGRRSEAVFALVAQSLQVDTETRTPRFLEMVGRSASALLRVTERAYLAALGDPRAFAAGGGATWRSADTTSGSAPGRSWSSTGGSMTWPTSSPSMTTPGRTASTT